MSGRNSKPRELKIERLQSLHHCFRTRFALDGLSDVLWRQQSTETLQNAQRNDLQQEANTLIDPRPTASMKTVASNGSFVDVSFK